MSKRKFQVGDQVVVKQMAPRGFRQRTGIVLDLGKGEYKIDFDDGRQPRFAELSATWMEKRAGLPEHGARETSDQDELAITGDVFPPKHLQPDFD